jgi:hypothetical protein
MRVHGRPRKWGFTAAKGNLNYGHRENPRLRPRVGLLCIDPRKVIYL